MGHKKWIKKLIRMPEIEASLGKLRSSWGIILKLFLKE
jgi:hypothetical protein